VPSHHPLPPGIGLGWRVEIAADLLASPASVDLIEVVAEACFASPAARREALAISRIWPVVPHGVKLSLGSADGIDLDRARRLGDLARDLRAPAISEHVAFVRGGGREIGHLTQLPFTREAVRVVAANVASARRVLPDVPFLLENAAFTFQWPGNELDEAAFYTEIVERTGCDLLLDLGNLYANAINAGADPHAVLRAYPLDRVAMIHIAGGALEGGFYFDSHAHAVPDIVFDLLSQALSRTGPIPILLERDGGFPAFSALSAELDRARAILAKAPIFPAAASRPERLPDVCSLPVGRLAADQSLVASLLTEHDAPPLARTAPFGADAIARSREVLRHKRVDDALPLLPRLTRHRETLRPLALTCIDGAVRAPALAGVADAIRIAEAAAGDVHLGADARFDALLLRSRFVTSSKGVNVRPRRGPFIGRERLPDGRVVWAVKGFGRASRIRIYETRAR
jgi:hypothetical protein